jgi:hypothetical protein
LVPLVARYTGRAYGVHIENPVDNSARRQPRFADS